MHASPLPWFVLSNTAPDSFAVVDTAMTIEWSGEKLWKDHLADLRACRTAKHQVIPAAEHQSSNMVGPAVLMLVLQEAPLGFGFGKRAGVP